MPNRPPVPFLDNDIILKLAEYDLLDQLVSLIKAKSRDMYVLDWAGRYFEDKRMSLTSGMNPTHTNAGVDRAVDFANGPLRITEGSNDEIHDALALIEDIDAGETEIISAALTWTLNPLVLTGDKRCIKALASEGSISDIRDRLRNHVGCLEEVVRSIIIADGFDSVLKGVKAAPQGCDIYIWRTIEPLRLHDWECAVSRLDREICAVESAAGVGWICRLA